MAGRGAGNGTFPATNCPATKMDFGELTEEECRQLELPKERIAKIARSICRMNCHLVAGFVAGDFSSLDTEKACK